MMEIGCITLMLSCLAIGAIVLLWQSIPFLIKIILIIFIVGGLVKSFSK